MPKKSAENTRPSPLLSFLFQVAPRDRAELRGREPRARRQQERRPRAEGRAHRGREETRRPDGHTVSEAKKLRGNFSPRQKMSKCGRKNKTVSGGKY